MVLKEYLKIWNPLVNYRKQPELYRIGKGQQGVLICQPYKSEILPHWRFKTPAEADVSSRTILSMFYNYLHQGDFVGADMAKKYLHMGFTRARRYANHSDGRKYDSEGFVLPQEKDALTSDKAKSATIFYHCWKTARTNPKYLKLKAAHKKKYKQ